MYMITPRQHEILSFINTFNRNNDHLPSLREIGRHFDITAMAARQHVLALQKKGALQESDAVTTRYALKNKPSSLNDLVFSVPLLGAIAAGPPTEGDTDLQESITVTRSLVGRKTVDFALRVQGDSMIGDCICNGDIVLIQKSFDLGTNDILAVRVDHTEYTLKRVRHEKNVIKLIASNPLYPPIQISTNQVEVAGKMVGLIRS